MSNLLIMRLIVPRVRRHTPHAERFPLSELELSDEELNKYGKHQLVPPPVWLGDALKFQSAERERLVGCIVAYRYEDDEGGWALGEISAALTDPEMMTEVEVEDSNGETLLGQMPFNYLVSFADGEASSLLQLDMYALNGRARDGSWVLLVAPPKGKKAAAKKQVVLPPPTPTQPQPQPQSRRAAAKAPAPKPAASKKPAAKAAKSPAPSKGAATAKAKGKAPSGLPIDLSKATPAQRRLMFQQLKQ